MIFHEPSLDKAVFDIRSAHWRTYRDLCDEVDRVSELLRTSAKALIFCFCRNDYETLCAYLAGLQSGQVTALLDDVLPVAMKSALIERYRPDFLVQSPLSAWSPDEPAYRLVNSSGPFVWRAVWAGDTAISGETALLLSTSGSTGTPKFVRLSLRNLMANAQSICGALDITAADRAVTSLPTHYSFGLSVINTHLLSGASLVLTDANITARPFWQTVRDMQVTSLAGVPYSYQLLSRLRLPGDDFPSLATLTQAGGKLQSDLVETFHRSMTKRGGRFFVMYGQTEATARIAILPPAFLPQKLGSAGRAIPGGCITIQPATAQAAPQMGGEVVYSGPNVMLGYANQRSDLCAGDELSSTLKTGDLGYLDEDGFLFITGRLSRYAKLSGHRFNLDEVESMLKSSGPAAVVGTEGKLVVFCEGRSAESLAQSRAAFARQLSIHFSLLDFRGISSLPLKANGKIDYSTLEELARC